MKPPKGYTFLFKTRSAKKLDEVVLEKLNQGWALVSEQSWFGTHYLFGRK